jgi:hypothetical protein
MAISEKFPMNLHNKHAGKEMTTNYLVLLARGEPNPETLALAITTTSLLEPKHFLAARDNSGPFLSSLKNLKTSGFLHNMMLYDNVLG